MVQVVPCHPAESEGIEVAEGEGGENHLRCRDFVQFGNMWVLEVELYSVDAHQHQYTDGPHEEQNPQTTLDAEPLICKHVRDAMQRGPAGENFNGRWSLAVHLLWICLQVHG